MNPKEALENTKMDIFSGINEYYAPSQFPPAPLLVRAAQHRKTVTRRRR
jgi:hypothetical protein